MESLRVTQSGRLINKACRESIMWNLEWQFMHVCLCVEGADCVESL